MVHTYAKKYSLFTWNANLTGHPVLLFTESDNPVYTSQFYNKCNGWFEQITSKVFLRVNVVWYVSVRLSDTRKLD